jgi:hypothetical protein
MARILTSFRQPLMTDTGIGYRGRACGRQRDDGRWEGWLEFEPDDGSEPLRTPRETTQPTLSAMEYWAAGLTFVYLEGALARAIDALRAPEPVEVVETPAYDAPAPSRAARESASEPVTSEAILDPFAIYARGEGLLRERLGALSARHLRGILRSYALAEDVALDGLDEAELIELIVAAVRTRMAA